MSQTEVPVWAASVWSVRRVLYVRSGGPSAYLHCIVRNSERPPTNSQGSLSLVDLLRLFFCCGPWHELFRRKHEGSTIQTVAALSRWRK